MTARTLLAVLALAAGGGLAGCSAEVSTGGKTVNTEEAENQIATQISEQTGTDATVTCPDDVKAEKGATFDCTAADADGNEITVVVTQKDDEGNVSFKTQE